MDPRLIGALSLVGAVHSASARVGSNWDPRLLKPAVAVAHDRAVERHKARLVARSQYPPVAAMVVHTVAGLLLLLNA
jgi:hypothetical protein